MTRESLEDRLYRLIGERVRRRRGDLTQNALADRIGLGRTSITNLESGTQRIPLHYLWRIAEALGCEVSDLIPTRAELEDQGSRIVLGTTGESGPLTDAWIHSHLPDDGP